MEHPRRVNAWMARFLRVTTAETALTRATLRDPRGLLGSKLPACDNEGTCHHPCDVETCGANESCAMADDFTTSCVCDENTFRSEATQECIAAGTCAGNLDCSMENPLCESGACIDPCAGACEDAQYCQILMDFSARCTCLAGFQDLDGDGSCTSPVKPRLVTKMLRAPTTCNLVSPLAIATSVTRAMASNAPTPTPAWGAMPRHRRMQRLAGPPRWFHLRRLPAGTTVLGNNCIEINECENHDCLNGGVCIDGENTYTCDCFGTGFEGTFCDQNIDDCASLNCQNGGACVDGVNTAACDCSGTGFEGTFCDQNIDDCSATSCQNGGTCVDGLNAFTCDCAGTGFEGLACESNINDCSATSCQNGGTCVDGLNAFTCDCSGTGFSGLACEKTTSTIARIRLAKTVGPASTASTTSPAIVPGLASKACSVRRTSTIVPPLLVKMAVLASMASTPSLAIARVRVYRSCLRNQRRRLFRRCLPERRHLCRWHQRFHLRLRGYRFRGCFVRRQC